MSQEFHYYSRGGAFDVNLGTQAARLGDYGGFSMKAEAGAIGNSTFIIDDPNGTVGYNNDGILGLKSFYVLETDCPPVGSNGIYGTRLYTGFFRERTYRRGTGSRSSLITGVAREIDATLEDLNSQASWSLISGTDGNRPAETDIARLQWLLGSKYLPARVYPGGSGPWTDWNEPGFIDTTGPVNMDANDYFGQDPASVIHDAAVASGKDWWFGYWEATGHNFLWYAFSETSTNYTSPLQISNVLADVDGVTTFAPEPDAEMRRDPSKTFSGVLVQASGVYSYQQNLTTGSNYAFRDGSAPNPNVKTQAQADAAAIRLLADATTEEDRITCRVRLPSSLATGIKQGQRVNTKLSFLPQPYGSNYNYWRVASLQVQQDEPTDKRYTLSMELTPQTAGGTSKYLIAIVTGGTGLGTTFDTSRSAYPWTAAYNPGNFAFPVQSAGGGAGPPEEEGFGLFYRAIHIGESGTNVLTVATSGPSTPQSAWVFEIDGINPAGLSVVSAGMGVIGANANTTVTASASVPSVLIGGIAWGKVNYDGGWCAGQYETNAVVSTVAGTPLLGTNGTSNANICNAAPPWTWGAYATGTGTLSLTANANDQGGGAYGAGFVNAHAGVLIPMPGTFSVVQSTFGTSTGTALVVNLPSAP